MTVAVRAVLFGAGLVAIGLIQPGAASVAPIAPISPDLNAARPAGTIENGELFDANPPGPGVRAAHRNDDPADQSEVDEESVEAPAAAGSRDSRWTAADVLYVRDRATPRARCIIDREVGGFGYDPWRRGTAGERGPVQLHPRGLLQEYLVWSGGQPPENPYYAIPFLEYKLRQGQGRNWSPVRLGLC